VKWSAWRAHLRYVRASAALADEEEGEGSEALCHTGHVLTENRHGLEVQAKLTTANGFAEREAALAMLEALPRRGRVTLGADRGHDVRSVVEQLREIEVTPHLAQNTSNRRSAIGGRTTRHAWRASAGTSSSPQRCTTGCVRETWRR